MQLHVILRETPALSISDSRLIHSTGERYTWTCVRRPAMPALHFWFPCPAEAQPVSGSQTARAEDGIPGGFSNLYTLNTSEECSRTSYRT